MTDKPCKRSCDDCAYEVDDPEFLEDVKQINELVMVLQEIVLGSQQLCDLLFLGNSIDITSVIPNSTECLRVSLSFVQNPAYQCS